MDRPKGGERKMPRFLGIKSLDPFISKEMSAGGLSSLALPASPSSTSTSIFTCASTGWYP